jgi:hypothetical protein
LASWFIAESEQVSSVTRSLGNRRRSAREGVVSGLIGNAFVTRTLLQPDTSFHRAGHAKRDSSLCSFEQLRGGWSG